MDIYTDIRKYNDFMPLCLDLLDNNYMNLTLFVQKDIDKCEYWQAEKADKLNCLMTIQINYHIIFDVL